MKSFLLAGLGISVVLNVLFVGFLFNSESSNSSKIKSDQSSTYPFLSKRIFVENQNDILINFVPLRSTLQNYVNKVPFTTGIYFEYLPTGNSIGVNEKASFIPASLLKLPLAMGVYKKLYNGELTKDQVLTVTEGDLNPSYGILWKQGAGTKISLMEVVEYLVKYSDNTAANMLLDVVEGKAINDVFDSLDIPFEQSNKELVISPKSYSSILRSLYLASFLNRTYSNELLKKLTETVYTDQLPYYIPKHIKVAHKIGANIEPSDQNSTYTDCGIIYVPKRPYILCAMVQAEKSEADKIISEVAKLTYDFVSKTNPSSN